MQTYEARPIQEEQEGEEQEQKDMYVRGTAQEEQEELRG